MNLRALVIHLVFLAFATSWSSGFAGAMYQTCPAECCAPAADHSGCTKASGDQSDEANGRSQSEDCTCNSTCDSTCSECEYFHPGAVQRLSFLPFALSYFTFITSNWSLEDLQYPSFRPPTLA